MNESTFTMGKIWLDLNRHRPASPPKPRSDIFDHVFGDMKDFHLSFVVEFGDKSARKRCQS